jgi:hypothetical protein
MLRLFVLSQNFFQLVKWGVVRTSCLNISIWLEQRQFWYSHIIVLMLFGEKMVSRTFWCYRDSPRQCGSNTRIVKRSCVICIRHQLPLRVWRTKYRTCSTHGRAWRDRLMACVYVCVRACGAGGAYFESRLKSFPMQALVSTVLQFRFLIP